MATREQIQMGPFSGLVTALDPEHIPDGAAADCLNVRLEDGVIRPRYGFRNLDAAPAGFSASQCFDYLQGYDNSYHLQEEYLSIETRSAVTKPYSANVTTGARTEIKNGVTALSLSALAARSVVFQGYAFVITPGDAFPLYQHSIGDNTSYTLVKVPTTPSAAITYTKGVGTGGQPFTTMKWTGMNPAPTHDVTGNTSGGIIDLTGDGTGKEPGGCGVTTDGAFFFALKSPIVNSFADQMQIDLRPTNSGNDYDWTAIDTISFNLASAITDGTGSVLNMSQPFTAKLINAAGLSLYGEVTFKGDDLGNGHMSSVTVTIKFLHKTPTDWTAIRYLYIQFTAYSMLGLSWNAAKSDLVLSPLTLGGANIAPTKVGDGLTFGYAYLNSAQSWESGIGGIITVPYDFLTGLNGLGTWLTLNWTASGDGTVDKVALYVQTTDYSNNTKTWRLISQFALGTTSYAYKMTYEAALALAARSTGLSGGAFPTANLVGACAFKNCMVWLYSGGGGVVGGAGNQPNIRFSQGGQPLILASNQDPVMNNPDNVYRPADFSLADNYSDDPIAAFVVGDSLIILGSQGVYEMTGQTPTTMTPPRRIDGSFGCAGYHSCARWKDEMGNPGVVYLSKNAEGLFLICADRYYLNQSGFKAVELTLEIRGLIRTYFGNGTDFSKLMVRVDAAKDAIYLISGTKALVFRRPFLPDGKRHWEPYQWNLGGIAGAAFSVQRRMRWIRTTGEIDENEWNSAVPGWIQQALGDGIPSGGGNGLAPALIYWTGKKMVGPNRRLDLVRVDRENLTDTPSITAYSTRETTTKTVASGKYQFRFGIYQQGFEHQIKIALGDGSGGVRRLVIDQVGPLGKRVQS